MVEGILDLGDTVAGLGDAPDLLPGHGGRNDSTCFWSAAAMSSGLIESSVIVLPFALFVSGLG